ncbi:hypothetical protein ACFLR3_00640 [Campylobacterota bacterium]
MKSFLIVIFLLSSLIAEQNNSTAFGTKQTLQDNFKTFKQKDASCFKGIVRGKEFFTYIELLNGYIALYNQETQSYEYAVIKDQKLLPSGIPVNTDPVPKEIEKISKKLLDQLQEKAFKKHL